MTTIQVLPPPYFTVMNLPPDIDGNEQVQEITHENKYNFSNCDLNKQDDQGSTPFIDLCKSNFENKREIIQQAIEQQGADPRIKHRNGWSPFKFLCKYGDLETIQFMNKHGFGNLKEDSLLNICKLDLGIVKFLINSDVPPCTDITIRTFKAKEWSIFKCVVIRGCKLPSAEHGFLNNSLLEEKL